MKSLAGEEQRWAVRVCLAWGTECGPALLEVRWAAGRGQTMKGLVREVRETYLDAEGNKGLKQGSLWTRTVPGGVRDRWEEARQEADRWRWPGGTWWVRNGGKWRTWDSSKQRTGLTDGQRD